MYTTAVMQWFTKSMELFLSYWELKRIFDLNLVCVVFLYYYYCRETLNFVADITVLLVSTRSLIFGPLFFK